MTVDGAAIAPWGDRFAINTYAYTQTMSAADCVRTLADRGVKAVELMLYPGHLWIADGAESLRGLRRALEQAGVTLLSLNSPNIDLNIAAATDEMRSYSLGLNREYLRLASELGAEGLILGPGKPNPLFPLPRPTLEGHFFRALDTLLPLAERGRVELWAENMPFAFLPDAESLMASLDRYGADAVKVCYDAANAHFIGEGPVAGLARVAPRLRLIHLSDTGRQVYRHDAVGLGDLDFPGLAPAIRAAGLPRPPVLEIVSHDADRDIGRSIAALSTLAF
jgi:sugar phosphate isomerase/epimerase